MHKGNRPAVHISLSQLPQKRNQGPVGEAIYFIKQDDEWFFLLSTHYRSPIEFSDEQLREAEASIDRYYTTTLRIQDFMEKAAVSKGASHEGGALSGCIASFKERFEEAMDDDFNTALALGHMFELIREINRFLDGNPVAGQDRGLLMEAQRMLSEAGDVLNVFQRSSRQWYVSLMHLRNIGLSQEDIQERLARRHEARKEKNWELADAIRKELEAKGVILEDKKDGTDWKIKVG